MRGFVPVGVFDFVELPFSHGNEEFVLGRLARRFDAELPTEAGLAWDVGEVEMEGGDEGTVVESRDVPHRGEELDVLQKVAAERIKLGAQDASVDRILGLHCQRYRGKQSSCTYVKGSIS